MLICSAEHVLMLTKSCYETQIEDQPFWRAHEPCMNHACQGLYRKPYGYNIGVGYNIAVPARAEVTSSRIIEKFCRCHDR